MASNATPLFKLFKGADTAFTVSVDTDASVKIDTIADSSGVKPSMTFGQSVKYDDGSDTPDSVRDIREKLNEIDANVDTTAIDFDATKLQPVRDDLNAETEKREAEIAASKIRLGTLIDPFITQMTSLATVYNSYPTHLNNANATIGRIRPAFNTSNEEIKIATDALKSRVDNLFSISATSFNNYAELLRAYNRVSQSVDGLITELENKVTELEGRIRDHFN